MSYTVVLDGTSNEVIGKTEVFHTFSALEIGSVIGWGSDSTTSDKIARWRVRYCAVD